MSAPMYEYRELIAQPPRVNLTHGDGGVLYLRHPDPLAPPHANLIAMIGACCARYAERTFLAERDGEGWNRIGYGEFADAVARTAAALAGKGLQPGTRVGLLAPNSIRHAIANFAVMAAGGVAVPLSPAYLDHPGGVALLLRMAQDAGIEWLLHADALSPPGADSKPWRRIVALGELAEASASAQAVDLSAIAAATPSLQAAKIFFTSGSTGRPKPLQLTHGMLCAAAAAMEQVGVRTPLDPPQLLDWLPWSHVYGGNVNVHSAIQRGGTLHIDGGAPIAGRFETTLRNLREVRPTQYTTVPAAFAPLIDALARDEDLAAAFFSRLHSCGFGGAALDAATIERFQTLSQKHCGKRMPFGGGYGMTETCGLISVVWWITERGDSLGLPVPGVEMKLVPLEGARMECRVRGPNVFAGYLDGSGEFDDEGFFATGDAIELAEPGNPQAGLIYGGRLREDFKLANGSWVQVGRLREVLLDRLRPLAMDLVILGENRDGVAALVWLAANAPDDAVDRIRAACRAFNAERKGATNRIDRLHVTREPPDAAAGEVTAKGTINVHAVAQRRTAEVARLLDSDDCRV